MSLPLAILMALAISPLHVAGSAAAPQSPPGTATIAGLIVTGADRPVPVKRATVRLVPVGSTMSRVVGTDELGRFTFDGLPAGNYLLSASKGGFVETFHGSEGVGRGPGVPLAISDGARISITLSLVLGAVISGIISDELGRPAIDVTVGAVSILPTGAPLIQVQTNDQGAYRFFGLAPGQYLIMAFPRSGLGLRAEAAQTITATTEAEIRWWEGSTPSKMMPSLGPSVALSPVFFPGTFDAGVATSIGVKAGQEQGGTNFTIRPAHVSTLAGSVVGPDGTPASAATVHIQLRQRTGASSERLTAVGALTLPRAVVSAPHFQISGLPPGDYTLIASSRSGIRGTAPSNEQARDTLWSVIDVTVDSDRRDMQLQLAAGRQLSGNSRFVGSSEGAPQFEMVLARVGVPLPGYSDPRTKIDPATGVFRFSGVPPGRYVIRSNARPPWFLESAMLGAIDVTDRPLDASDNSGTWPALVATFSRRPARIDGRLVDAAGRAVTQFAVVVFPADQAMWHPLSRRIQWVRPATDGRFSFDALPEGDYAIAAARDVWPGDLDTALLSELLTVSHRLKLLAGARENLTLSPVR